MGRALFSQTYHSSPAVRTEPEPGLTPYEKWTHWNAFDPDSDEFFESEDAVYEAFVDPAQFRREEEEQEQALVVEGSSSSSEASVSDRGSPMAVGSDDPASMIADAYSSVVDWEERFLLAGRQSAVPTSDLRRLRDPRQSTELQGVLRSQPPRLADNTGDVMRMNRGSRQRSATVSSLPPLLPPSSLRHSTSPTDPRPSPLSRTFNITPIDVNVPLEPPSPTTPGSPVTPEDQVYSHQFQMLSTPSPAPTVTPRLYTWNTNRHTTPLNMNPASPTPSQGSGPLTNPSARMSLARLAPARVRVQNVAI